MPPKKIQRPGCSHDSEPWLKRVDGDPCKAFCEMCQSTFTSEIFVIKRHKSSSHHLSNTSRSSPSLPSTSTSTSTSPTADMATRVDIKFMLLFFSLDITSLSVISILLQICWKMLLQTDIYQEYIFEKVKGTLCCTKYWANCTKNNHERLPNLQVFYNYSWDHWPQLCKIGCSGCQKLWQLRKDIKN